MSDVANRYTLKTPVKTGKNGDGELITEVTLRRLIARDLRKTDAAKGEVGKAIILMACSTGLDQATVENLDSADFEEIFQPDRRFHQLRGAKRGVTGLGALVSGGRALGPPQINRGTAMTARQIVRNAAQLDDLAHVIGRDAVVKLCAALGGTKVYVPRKIGGDHPIAAAIGVDAAARLAAFYHGDALDLPKAHLRRQRAIQLLDGGGLTTKEIALRLDFTERHVRRVKRALPGSARAGVPHNPAPARLIPAVCATLC